MAPREGSRKASVFTTFAKEGAEAAIAIGTSLGLKLGTIRSWVGMWSKVTDGSEMPIPKKHKVMLTKSTITVTWDPERTAYLIDEGPEVSEIRWADTGAHQFISNTHLKK